MHARQGRIWRSCLTQHGSSTLPSGPLLTDCFRRVPHAIRYVCVVHVCACVSCGLRRAVPGFPWRLPIRASFERARGCVCAYVLTRFFVCTGHWHGARVPAPVPRSNMTKSPSHPNVQPQRGPAEKGCNTWSGRYARFVVSLPTVSRRDPLIEPTHNQ